ncbi:hypothetical protein HER17_17910 [Pectobacterium carotovorum]|nr:hypothetical protein [Pectobacterium carotovorum]MDK9421745.1 hypothetical protein [Pectobacterium carotovorum]QLL94697.1 hypothetical protein HER17_17910 [Pectobacterium carotovorum]
MKAIQLRAPSGLERLEIVDLPDPGAPGLATLRSSVSLLARQGLCLPQV